MADIRVNDIFYELIEENEKITECLNVLIRFKTFVDMISDYLKNNLESKVLTIFEDFHKEVEEVFRRNEMEFTVNRNLIQRKSQLVESSKPPKSDEIKQQLSSDQTIHSTKVGSKQLKPRLSLTTKKKTSKNQMKTTQREEVLISDENQRFVCSFIGCGKELKSKDGLRLHLRRHTTDVRRHKCHFEGCSFSFEKRSNLTNHINKHNGIRPHSCDQCGKRFASYKQIRQHINYTHKVSDHSLICKMDECYKQFKTEHTLKSHQKFHHLDEKRFACSQPNCTFKATHNSTLKIHMFNVHSDERPFVCDFEGCSKSYKNIHQLNIHIQTHSSEAKFKCLTDGCEKTFKTAKNLKTHTLHSHSGPELGCDWPGCDYTTKTPAHLRKHQIIHSSERNFLCVWPQCGKAFKTKDKLNIHLRIHTNDKRYVCSWPGCQYRCTHSGNFFKHKKIHIKS